ncbi:MAG: DUF937 domain-containing protein [Pseudomonadota bacterium]
MSEVLVALAGRDDSQAVQNLAAGYDIEPTQARKAMLSVIPELADELERLTLSTGGVADFVALMGRAQFEDFLSQPELVKDKAAVAEGQRILAEIFATKYKSRVASARAARMSGLDTEAVKLMLPAIAGLFMGEVTTQVRGTVAQVAKQNNAFKSPRSNGDPFSDQSALPKPSQTGGEDVEPQAGFGELAECIREAGNLATLQPNSLPNAVRQTIGTALGFQSTGIASWFIKTVMLRQSQRFMDAARKRMNRKSKAAA